MVFSSLNFIFLFLPSVLTLYFIFMAFKQRRICNLVLLGASLVFYACSSPKYIFLLLASILISHFAGFFCGKVLKRKRLFLILGIGLDLSLLFYFKYADFFIENAENLIGVDFGIKSVVLPVGISFFTFQGMSYIADVYKGVVKPQKNILNTALYISLFPQLIAGPIVRYSDIEKDLDKRRETIRQVFDGFVRFSLGLGKKVIIADSVGLMADRIFKTDMRLYSVSLAWAGVLAYTFQIYFDFSGYSDMAIGLGKIFGFHFPENFNYPYISRSITEFWRRWHMSLSAWFRDYVYIPLGGNRCSALRHIINIIVVWTLTGFWHGADWNFIAWGAYFALILIGEKYLYGNILERLPVALKHIYAILLIMVGWAVFYGGGISSELIKTMFFIGRKPLISSNTIYYLNEFKAELILAAICSLPVGELVLTGRESSVIMTFAKGLFGFFVFVVSICFIVTSNFSPFIYFRF